MLLSKRRPNFYFSIIFLFSFWISSAYAQTVVVDMDGAVDDYLALSILLEMPAAQLSAIVATDGLATVEAGLQGCEILFKRCQENLPLLGAGEKKPLKGKNQFPQEWRNQAATLFQLPLRFGNHELHAGSMKPLKLPLIRTSFFPQKSILLVTGPLSTLAQLIRNHAISEKTFEKIIIMGGAWKVSGNVEATYPALKYPDAEWNIFNDPEGAREAPRCDSPGSRVRPDPLFQGPE